MDIATLIGVLTGFGLVVGAIFLGGDMRVFLDLPSAMIVLGGSLAATLVSFPIEEVIQAFKAGFKAFRVKRPSEVETIRQMVRIAEISRREGFVALDEVKTQNPILRKACRLIADNADPSIVRDALRIEIESLKKRHAVGQAVFRRLGAAAPAFGMIGTLIGLTQMLARLSDPRAIGPGMAVAILTTFYGAMLSTLVFLPIAAKLQARTLQEILQLEIIFEGAKSILENNNPRFVEDKLSAFAAPRDRRTLS